MSDEKKAGSTGKSARKSPRASTPRREERPAARKAPAEPPPEEIDPVEYAGELEEDSQTAQLGPAETRRPQRERADEPETEAFTLQVYYDREEGMYAASFVEFPELKVLDLVRSEAVYLAEDKLHSKLASLRQAGQPVPNPIHRTKEYPSSIELPVSQTLYRKLEARRIQERVSIEQCVAELLTSALEGRSHHNSEKSGNRDNRGGGDRGQARGRQGGGGGRQGGGGRGRYDKTLENRENFMEYVRNLEKGGGGAGGGGRGGGGRGRR